jgi:tRNA A37 N6-isopentenylltransferase MiaA
MASAPVPPFADASPAEIRAALLEEEKPDFDQQFLQALQAAADTLNLAQLHRTLRCWRRVAWRTLADPAAHRRMLRTAEHILSTGEPLPGGVPWNQLRAELGLTHAGKTGYERTQLVVLRGNSGSGKSSIATALRAQLGRGTAIVQLLSTAAEF